MLGTSLLDALDGRPDPASDTRPLVGCQADPNVLEVTDNEAQLQSQRFIDHVAVFSHVEIRSGDSGEGSSTKADDPLLHTGDGVELLMGLVCRSRVGG